MSAAGGNPPRTPPDKGGEGGNPPRTPPDKGGEGGNPPRTPPDKGGEGGNPPRTPPDKGGEGGNPPRVPPDKRRAGGKPASVPSDSIRSLPPDLARLLHDVRGPLNSLTMHLQVLKRTVGDDPIAEDSLRTVQEQIARLADMLPAAFSVAALETGGLRPIDLGAVMEAARDEAGANVTLANASWPSVRGDERLLTLALGHLLRNAVEATPAGRPWPMVSAKVAGAETLIEVRDWGTGLKTTDPKLLIKLMHSTKAGHRGLGLVTAERVARLHGGTLRFESSAEGGTAVTMALPSPR
jgi:two-component system, NtrC family, sensor histidine kinase HydH